MSEECNHDCSSCAIAHDCGDREKRLAALKEQPHQLSRIKKVYAVVSGKGGVGKSLVTSLLAVAFARQGFRTAVLDADLTGPSIPRAFGVDKKAESSELGFYPVKSRTGVELMSLNLLLEHDTDPVVWRGPMIAATVKQFWTDVIWGDIDYMFVDMPPGTGDVPLTVYQSLPLDGIIVVTSPQELVEMIVAKAVRMAEMMNIPVLGLVENLSYFRCPDCGSRHYPFGESHADEAAARFDIKTVCRLPIDPALAAAVDAGKVEDAQQEGLEELLQALK